MKKNDLVEVKKITLVEARNRALKITKEITGLVLDKNTGKLSNLRAIKSKRRDLAQILTIVKQKELLENLETK